MKIDLNPEVRPEVYRPMPRTIEEKLAIYEEVLAQHGLKVANVTHKPTSDANQIQDHAWFALVWQDDPREKL